MNARPPSFSPRRTILGFLAGGLAALTLWGVFFAAGGARAANLSEREVLRAGARALVMLRTIDATTGRPIAQGSGAVVARVRGLLVVLTAAHVLDPGARIMALDISDHAPPYGTCPGVEVARSTKLDLALVAVCPDLVPGVLDIGAPTHEFDSVWLLGHPAGAPRTVARGVVSFTHHPRPEERGGGYVQQITGFAWPGSSGGPVVDAHGQLVGVTQAIQSNDCDDAGCILVPQVVYAAQVDVIAPFVRTALGRLREVLTTRAGAEVMAATPVAAGAL